MGANTSTVDPGCTARETARIAAMLGRMDIANAVLENTSVVQEALKAKAARQAAELAVPDAATPAAAVQPAPDKRTADRGIEEALLREQQRLAVEALQRKSTMDKVYDTLTFTDAKTQGSEKTPQQVMAEETIKKQAERDQRRQEQMKLEQRLAALKSEPPERLQYSLAPLVPSLKLALAAPRAAPVATPALAPVAPASAVPAAAAVPAKEPPAEMPTVRASNTAPEKVAVPAPSKAQQPALDSLQAARLLRNAEPIADNVTAPASDKGTDASADRATASATRAAPGPAQTPPPRDAVAVPAKEQPKLASQPMLRNVKMEKLNEMFGFVGATAPNDATGKATPDAADSAARPVVPHQAAKHGAPAQKPAEDAKNKAPVQPDDALNVARAVLNVQ